MKKKDFYLAEIIAVELKNMNNPLQQMLDVIEHKFLQASDMLLGAGDEQLSEEEWKELDKAADNCWERIVTLRRWIGSDAITQRNPVTFEGVDLGLPSGKKWATCNVDADSPECQGMGFNFDDAQLIPMAEGWRVPTSGDFQELCDNCTREWIKFNGVEGRRFTSKKNGHFIFFPCSGYGNGTSWYNRGSLGYYWSASLGSATQGRSLSFRSGGVYPQDNYNRFYGFAVRAVQD